MTIYINGRFLMQNQTGINRFAYELCKALTALGISFIVICPNGKIKSCYDTSLFDIKYFGFGSSHIWEQFFLPLYFSSRKGKNLLLNFSGIGPVVIKNKIMTIHDLAFIHNPKWYSWSYRNLYKFLTPLSARSSLRILTVSNFSKNEIIKLLRIDSKKISVIYNSVADIFINDEVKTIHDNQSEKYVLAVSSIDPRKNFKNLLQGFLLINDPSLKLYIIGGEAKIYSESINQLQSIDMKNSIKWLGRVPDEDLKFYYQNATCFIYPSLYEGFGIPPIESMACGTPAIVSDIPPLREVCGNAAIYVNPLDKKDIADKILNLCHDDNLLMELSRAGKVQFKKYNWQESAKRLCKIIEEVQYSDIS